jgi:hypothetical protein
MQASVLVPPLLMPHKPNSAPDDKRRPGNPGERNHTSACHKLLNLRPGGDVAPTLAMDKDKPVGAQFKRRLPGGRASAQASAKRANRLLCRGRLAIGGANRYEKRRCYQEPEYRWDCQSLNADRSSPILVCLVSFRR